MTGSIRLTRKERDAAAATQRTYLAVPGPSVPDTRVKVKPHLQDRPEIYLPHERTLIQPRLPPLLHHPWSMPQRAESARDVQGRDEPYDDRDLVPLDDMVPAPDPTQHPRKRAAQWRRWQTEVLPNLLPHFVRVLHETKSLRHSDNLSIQLRSPDACTCASKVHRISLVRFSCK
jgi:hypothetical protein